MNLSTVLTAVALTTAAASSASASVSYSRSADVHATAALVSRVDFVQGHEAVATIPAQQAFARAEAGRNSAERYFDFDVLITAGALAIASGAFLAGAVGRTRRDAVSGFGVQQPWREAVLRNLDADLTQFSEGLRRAA